MSCRHRRKGRKLAKRYGCFRLPKIRGVKVKESKQKDATWLARTDPKAKEIEFSEAYNRLSDEGKKYIVLHERAHVNTGTDHNADFYQELRKLIKANGVSWEVAYELESWNCHSKH